MITTIILVVLKTVAAGLISWAVSVTLPVTFSAAFVFVIGASMLFSLSQIVEELVAGYYKEPRPPR